MANLDEQGFVVKKALGRYDVKLETRVVSCVLSSKLRKNLVYQTADRSSVGHRSVQSVRNVNEQDPVAIGDFVRFVPAGDGTGMITTVLPRRNKFVRPAAGSKEQAQVIAANIDQLVTIFAAARPEPTWHLLDRYLIAAEAQELPVLIVITKSDLLDAAHLNDELAIYEQLGYSVLRTSAHAHAGISELKNALHGKLSVFVGKSGVGKTSLLNALQPGLGLRVNEISESTGKGRHTTTHLELFDLDFGGQVVDTPGVKEFGLWGLEEHALDWLFPEMRSLLGRCQFGASCQHTHEPGCAIKMAVAAGQIAERRYKSYTIMLNEA